jgi:hypothetical protein
MNSGGIGPAIAGQRSPSWRYDPVSQAQMRDQSAEVSHDGVFENIAFA